MKDTNTSSDVTSTPPQPHPLVALARRAAETWVRDQRLIAAPDELVPEMNERAGVFVCLKIAGELRGCIGTFEPTQRNVAEETITNAVAAATSDPRFQALTPAELHLVDYSVDVLTPPERVHSAADLDPKNYGVIVRSGPYRGLLLPDLEGVDTVEAQVSIAKRKAGLSPRDAVDLYRFSVRRFG